MPSPDPFRSSRFGLVLGAIALAICASTARPADASCNFVPGTENTFRASLSSLDRPFAAPGDPVTLSLDLTGCESSAGAGLIDLGTNVGPDDDYQVVLIFTPPNGPANALVLQDGPVACAGFAGSAQANACQAELPVLGAGDPTATRQAICQAADLVIPDSGTLIFPFPDTNALAGPSAPAGSTLAGTVKIAIQPRDPAGDLPCELASNRCADTVVGSDLVACVDELYDVNDTCETDPAQIQGTFPSFTALPVYNNYEAMCTPEPGSPCDGIRPDARFTIDTAGNLLVPVNWAGVLVRLDDGTPVPRLVNLSSEISAFTGSADAIRVPGQSFSSALSPQGHFLPPILSPFAEEGGGSVVLYGSVDAPFSITRINRRGETFAACAAGSPFAGEPCNLDEECGEGFSCDPSVCHQAPNLGERPVPLSQLPAPLADVACNADSDCPSGSECGPSLFDFSTRFAGEGCGPTLDDTYVATAGNLVPLESLFIQQSDDILALPRVEAFEAAEGSPTDADFNADGDVTDIAMTMVNRETGTEQQIGIQATAVGVAATQVIQPPYRFTAVGVEDDILAFLQSEPTDFGNDLNSNNRVEDNFLRVYQRSADDATPNAPLNPLTTADAGPVIDGLSLAISDGQVFYRVSEADEGERVSTPSSSDADGNVPVEFSSFSFTEFSRERAAMSSDGRFVAYDTTAVDIVTVPADTNDERDVYLIDRDPDEDGLYDEPGEILTELISVATNGDLGDEGSGERFTPGADVSDDGRFVVFPSRASNFGAPGSFVTHVYLRDRQNGTTTWISRPPCAAGSSSDAEYPVISNDGSTAAWEVSPQEGEPPASICTYDVATDTVELVLPGSEGDPGFFGDDIFNERPSLSEDGRYLAFATNRNIDENDVDGDGYGGGTDVYILDRETGQAEWASPGAATGFSSDPSISADGKRVAFTTTANLLPEDTGGSSDVYVYHADAERLQFVPAAAVALTNTYGASVPAVLSVGEPPRISPDGRYVAMVSELVFDPIEGTVLIEPQSLQVDLTTGITHFTAIDQDGVLQSVEPNEIDAPGISTRGLHAGLATIAPLVAFDGNERIDTYIHGIRTRLPGIGGLTGDLLQDGDLDDILLHVFDARSPGAPTQLGPASQASVAAGNAAFLCDEDADRIAPVDGNGDTDTDDVNVCFYTNRGSVQNLGEDASEVKLSETHLAARVDDGVAGGDVVSVWDVTAGGWTPVTDGAGAAQTSDEICGVSGPIVSFTTLESEQGVDANGDGDMADRYAQAYDASTGTLLEPGIGAQFCEIGPFSGVCVGAPGAACTVDDDCGAGEFCDAGACRAFGETCAAAADCQTGETCREGALIGIATREISLCAETLFCEEAQNLGCGCDLDGDGDCCDFEEGLLLSGCSERDFCLDSGIVNTCGCDLNGDGDCCDDVLSAYDTANDRLVSCELAITPCVEEACDPRETFRVDEAQIRALTQECSQGVEPTIADGSCGFFDGVPLPGGDLNANGVSGELLVALCFGRSGEVEIGGTVETGDSQGDPLAGSGGDTAFLGEGLCFQQTATVCGSPAGAMSSQDCGGDEICDIAPGADMGVCARQLGSCVTDADCPGCGGETPCIDATITCRDDRILVASGDIDGDGVSDAFDNCVFEPNVQQTDVDQDDLGDACDFSTCGNGVLEANEACDDGNLDDGDSCPSDCRAAAPPMVCDVDGNEFIDSMDIQLITQAFGQTSTGPGDPRDANGDGSINVFDARICTLSCDRPNCQNKSGCGLLGIELLLVAIPYFRRRARQARAGALR
ncbi:MAG: dockerin type I domain-containing protein [Myxococcota bacterium]